jgi:glycosyltransferase involved in cell wall biosynthesis
MMLDFYLLIPCYNNVEGLIRSLRSVVYPKDKCSVLIVDDGSETAITAALIPEEIHQVLHIEIIRLANNQGITAALNTGLHYIHSKKNTRFIARLDCGDTCTIDRFIKQVHFLSVNTSVSLIGSMCLFVDRVTNEHFIYKPAASHRAIKKQMHFKCSFIHPTVMFRADEILDTIGFYPSNFPYAEDYAFFFSIVNQYETSNLQEVLVETEINTKGISITKRSIQIHSKKRIIKEYGSHPIYRVLGIMQQNILSLLPHQFILAVKKRLYNN